MSVSDTRRRAELRGREAVARSRLTAGVWVTRVFAGLITVTTVIALAVVGVQHWRGAVIRLIWAAALVIAAQRIEKGSRVDAVVLFLLFLPGPLFQLFTDGGPGLVATAINIAVLVVLGNAVRGTFELARIRREEAEVPPAPDLAPAGAVVPQSGSKPLGS